MKVRDGLLLAPVLLIGVMIAVIAFAPSHLAEVVLWLVASLSGLSIGSYVVLSLRAQRRRETEAAASERRSKAPTDAQSD